MTQERNELELRLATIEKRLTEIEETLARDGYTEMKRKLEEIRVLVEGNPKLEVKSLRELVNEMYTTYDRLKWMVGVIGITTLSALIGLIATLVKLFAK